MATTEIKHASIPELIAGVLADAREIAAGHATKARDEIKEEFVGLKHFLMFVAVGVGLGILGAILLAHACALGLDALGVPMWLSYLIAAVVFVGVGVVLIKRLPANKKDIDLIPETALAELKRDVTNIKDEVKHEVKEPGRPAHAHY